MQRRPRVFVPVVLTALVLLATAGPAAAHSPNLSASSLAGAPDAIDTIVPVLTAAPAPPALPWYLPVVLALGVAAVWRRPRRALAVALVMLLCVFAFENALHSVHHGLDPKQQTECTVAAAAAHLAAVQVDGITPPSLVLPTAGGAVEAGRSVALIRFLSPEQGRAPPSAIL